MKKTTFIFAATLLLCSWVVHADVTEIAPLQKCGAAKLRVLFWDVYESTLFTPSGNYEPDARPFRLDIRYLRDISAKDLINQTKKEWRAQGLVNPQQDEWLITLADIWPNVATGDTLVLLVDEENHSEFSMNGVEIGRIESAQFSAAFAGIWLSPKTTRPALRAALIRGHEPLTTSP